MRRWIALGCAAWLLAPSSGAQPGVSALLPTAAGAAELLDPHARAARVLRRDEPLMARPDGSAPRRGSAAAGASFEVYGAARGPGCASPWLLVGPSAWLCASHVELGEHLPPTTQAIRDDSADGLPLDYYYVTEDGSFAYDRFASAGTGIPVPALAKRS